MSVELGLDEYRIIERLDSVINVLKKSVVSFDIDGVEINSAAPAVEKFNRIFGAKYKVDDLKTYWSMVEWVKIADPSIEDPRSYAINLWNSKDVFEDAPPAAGAWLLGNYLRQKDYLDIYRITSRPSRVTEITLGWYAAKMPWVDRELIHIQQDGIPVQEGSQLASHKIETINRLGIQLHFEDSFEEAEAIVSNTDAKVILVPAPWNSDYKNPMDGITVVGPTFNKAAPRLISVLLDLYGHI